ncbi:putative metalloprotease CJM1_0395 family protein [Thermodesulforhabdus norvegica]|uniref:SprA-related family protein n=1 Tax=Thermodesulforhabdus norvegica TaxID=39841 RepID=A0A1I4VZ28_9BACT|nr:putative metalloprotease CJM1_0395 family protein [Thermodesulforhabdus norvegica]SFN06493.1 SprA-related family protein [Thermodesulforhabdus norvegica]
MIQAVNRTQESYPVDQSQAAPFRNKSVQGLSEEEIKKIQKLKQRDREVRTHEQAHIAAGGRYVRGAARFEYERGPDGKLYAVGGEVSLDVSPVPNDPEATIEKMQVIKRAALAPAQPSAQDRLIAARADMEIQQARQELLSRKAQDAYTGYRFSGSSDGQTTLSIYA